MLGCLTKHYLTIFWHFTLVCIKKKLHCICIQNILTNGFYFYDHRHLSPVHYNTSKYYRHKIHKSKVPLKRPHICLNPVPSNFSCFQSCVLHVLYVTGSAKHILGQTYHKSRSSNTFIYKTSSSLLNPARRGHAHIFMHQNV